MPCRGVPPHSQKPTPSRKRGIPLLFFGSSWLSTDDRSGLEGDIGYAGCAGGESKEAGKTVGGRIPKYSTQGPTAWPVTICLKLHRRNRLCFPDPPQGPRFRPRATLSDPPR